MSYHSYLLIPSRFLKNINIPTFLLIIPTYLLKLFMLKFKCSIKVFEIVKKLIIINNYLKKEYLPTTETIVKITIGIIKELIFKDIVVII